MSQQHPRRTCQSCHRRTRQLGQTCPNCHGPMVLSAAPVASAPAATNTRRATVATKICSDCGQSNNASRAHCSHCGGTNFAAPTTAQAQNANQAAATNQAQAQNANQAAATNQAQAQNANQARQTTPPATRHGFWYYAWRIALVILALACLLGLAIFFYGQITSQTLFYRPVVVTAPQATAQPAQATPAPTLSPTTAAATSVPTLVPTVAASTVATTSTTPLTGAYMENAPNSVSLWVDPNGTWQVQKHYWLVQHASGTGTTISYTLHIPSGFVGVVEANIVNGVGGGHLLAFAGPDDVKIVVTNGVVGITKAEWGKELFVERWNVLVENNWDRKDVQPLPEWDLNLK